MENVVDKRGYHGPKIVTSVVSRLTVDLTRLSAIIASGTWVTEDTSVRVSSNVKGSRRTDTVSLNEGDRHWKLTSGII